MDNNNQNRQFLTFRLAEEQYGLDVLKVREVLEVPQITRVPRMPEYLKGVINIRGSVLSVIDLRRKLGLADSEYTVHSRVIIIEIDMESEHMSLGILVDSVQEVLDISMAEVSPAPHIGTAIDSGLIDGIAKREKAFIMLLNINRVFDSAEVQHMSNAFHETAAVTTFAAPTNT
jgi:purine-binding chemotaxis protein CheW